MGFVELTVGDGGDSAAVSRVLGVMSDQVADLEEVWREVVFPWARQHFKQQFETDGAHGGQPWVGYDNEPQYAEAKEEMVGHNELLRWQMGGPRENLYPSITSPDHPLSDWEVNDRMVKIGSRVPHGPDLERATTGPDWSGNEPSPPRIIMTAKHLQKEALMVQVQRAIVDRVPSMDEARAHL